MSTEQYQPRLKVKTLTMHGETQRRTFDITVQSDADEQVVSDQRGFPVSIDIESDTIEELEQKRHLLGYLAGVPEGRRR